MNKFIATVSLSLVAFTAACGTDVPVTCGSGASTAASTCSSRMRSDVVGQQNGSMASAQNANSTTEAELEKLKKEQEKKNDEALRVAKLQEQRMAQLEQQLKEQQAVASAPVPATEDPQPESKNKKNKKNNNNSNNNNNNNSQNGGNSAPNPFVEIGTGVLGTIANGFAKGVAGKVETIFSSQK
jgi:vacuolar-type H+-ATPase subunit I/STV1